MTDVAPLKRHASTLHAKIETVKDIFYNVELI
jgi:hypothetical protein